MTVPTFAASPATSGPDVEHAAPSPRQASSTSCQPHVGDHASARGAPPSPRRRRSAQCPGSRDRHGRSRRTVLTALAGWFGPRSASRLGGALVLFSATVIANVLKGIEEAAATVIERAYLLRHRHVFAAQSGPVLRHRVGRVPCRPPLPLREALSTHTPCSTGCASFPLTRSDRRGAHGGVGRIQGYT